MEDGYTFPAWTNTAATVAAVSLVVLVVGGLSALMVYVRTPYNTEQLTPIHQPVEFDHRHHVRDGEIDCLYCHREAERSPSAGIPATKVCMGCHSQIWNDSPLLEPVRRSWFSGEPIPWRRVHDLADFVYFDHSVHVRFGIGCVRCHGRVDQMAQVYQVAPLTMGWCLDCHRVPAAALSDQPVVNDAHRTMWGATLHNLEDRVRDDRPVTRLTTCTACHR